MLRLFASVLLLGFLSGVTGANLSTSITGTYVAPENGCVRCHSRLSTPSRLADRFLDWRASRHGDAGITCDKCHGGDSTTRDPARAHAGVSSPSNSVSRLHATKMPATCGGCHTAIVNSFVESKHYSLLRANEGAPSCISCHGHMTSSVARAPADGHALCTFCHNTLNGPLPQRSDIPRRAQSTLDAIVRTNYMIGWINELLEKARKRKLSVRAEEEDLRLLRLSLGEVKIGWHAFTLESPAVKAEKTFRQAVTLKDNLIKRLGLD